MGIERADEDEDRARSKILIIVELKLKPGSQWSDRWAMHAWLLLLCFLGLHAGPLDNVSLRRYQIWASVALEYVRNVSCDQAFFAAADQCRRMKQTGTEQMLVYAAEAGVHRKLAAATPDGALGRSGLHDGVVLVDPFPAASFGHFVIAFFVDRLPRADCELYGGIFNENHNDCLRLMLKDGCHNLLVRQQWQHRRRLRRQHSRENRCEIDFLPLIYESDGGVGVSHDRQRLACREAPGFARCPSPAPDVAVVQSRTSDDDQLPPTPTPTPTPAPTTPMAPPPPPESDARCRLFEMCDHAVIVHGQWGQLQSGKKDNRLLTATRKMLNDNGFADDNLAIFYKNGSADSANRLIGSNLYVHPATHKRRLRLHLKKLCSRPHCVDSLVLFLKGPAMQTGSLLLGDVDGNGLASDREQYSVSEIMDDLASCLARRVFVIADYSYSGRLTKMLSKEQQQRASRYRNVVVVTSGDDAQYSWDNQFTESWLNRNYRNTCFKSTFTANKDLFPYSNPTIFDGGESTDEELLAEETTIFGAPCNVNPPLTDAELREKYLGCNNVPSWLWFQNITNHSKL